MSNFKCEYCGAVHIDNGVGKGYSTKQCKTTSEVIEELCMKLNATNTANAGLQTLNEKLKKENEIFKTALEKISKNSDCVCSLDETCLPMRDAARALAAVKGAK